MMIPYYLGPGHTDAFLKVSVFISTKRSNENIFPTLHFWIRFRISSTLTRPKTLMGTTYHLSTTESFQNDTLWKGSTFETVF